MIVQVSRLSQLRERERERRKGELNFIPGETPEWKMTIDIRQVSAGEYFGTRNGGNRKLESYSFRSRARSFGENDGFPSQPFSFLFKETFNFVNISLRNEISKIKITRKSIFSKCRD